MALRLRSLGLLDQASGSLSSSHSKHQYTLNTLSSDWIPNSSPIILRFVVKGGASDVHAQHLWDSH